MSGGCTLPGAAGVAPSGIQTEQLGRTTCTTFGKIGPYPRMKIVVVIPVCNEQHTLETLTEGIVAQLSEQDYRILFVDDGSTDGTWQVIQQLHDQDPAVHGIRLRKNFGKAMALSAGFDRARAETVVMMDADLQDDPVDLPKMLEQLEDGLDVVVGWKVDRKDPLNRRVFSFFFNKTVGIVSFMII